MIDWIHWFVDNWHDWFGDHWDDWLVDHRDHWFHIHGNHRLRVHRYMLLRGVSDLAGKAMCDSQTAHYQRNCSFHFSEKQIMN